MLSQQRLVSDPDQTDQSLYPVCLNSSPCSAGRHPPAALLPGGLRRGGDLHPVGGRARAHVVPRDLPLPAAPVQGVLHQQLHLHGGRHLGRAPQGHLLAAHAQARLLALRRHGLLRSR